MKDQLRSGDLVEVRSAGEILSTLDGEGTLDGLPFMPEMLQFCGQQHRVFQSVVQAVIDTAFLTNYSESFVREFKGGQVVLLQNVRCSGLKHDGCSRGCMIFWKEAWLKKADEPTSRTKKLPPTETLASSLKSQTAPGKYFCQSSEILKATNHLPHAKRLAKWFQGVAAGNYTLGQMIRQTIVWAYWRVRRRFRGEWPRGDLTTTPSEALALQPGEFVQVKSLSEILQTLDRQGKNRGLHFSADMALLCGKNLRVRSRADNWVAEGTGKLSHLRNTVILEEAICDSSYYAFGGCPRSDFQYWREIWLKRVEPQAKPYSAELVTSRL